MFSATAFSAIGSRSGSGSDSMAWIFVTGSLDIMDPAGVALAACIRRWALRSLMPVFFSSHVSH